MVPGSKKSPGHQKQPGEAFKTASAPVLAAAREQRIAYLT